MTARTWCSAGDCITVTESTQHPNVVHIGTVHDGQPGRVQLTVTRGEYDAHVAGIKAEEQDRIATHVRELRAAAQHLADQSAGSLLEVGFHAQDEVLASVLHLIGETS